MRFVFRRPLALHYDPDGSFRQRVDHAVTRLLTEQYGGLRIILELRDINRAPITRVDQGAIIENERLSEALEIYRAIQGQVATKAA